MLTDEELKSVNAAIGGLTVTEVFGCKESLLTMDDIDTMKHADKVVFVVLHKNQQEKKPNAN